LSLPPLKCAFWNLRTLGVYTKHVHSETTPVAASFCPGGSVEGQLWPENDSPPQREEGQGWWVPAPPRDQPPPTPSLAKEGNYSLRFWAPASRRTTGNHEQAIAGGRLAVPWLNGVRTIRVSRTPTHLQGGAARSFVFRGCSARVLQTQKKVDALLEPSSSLHIAVTPGPYDLTPAVNFTKKSQHARENE
jgi:hypothetical protein